MRVQLEETTEQERFDAPVADCAMSCMNSQVVTRGLLVPFEVCGGGSWSF